ncbi:MAG: hypothetical protein ACTS2F_13810 [Thainema sp.]
MKFPPLQLIDHTHFCLQGEVEIDPSAAIAPGVLFQADSDSRIVIGAGVCIGAGSVLHARQGSLIIEPGVSFGTGVLIVGAGRIGANACIGSSSTVLRPAIAPGDVVPPGSLLGDTSRQVTIDVPSVAAESEDTQSAPSSQSAYRSANQSAASAQATQFSPQSSQNQQNGYQAASAATKANSDSFTASQAANGQTAEERDRKNQAQDVDAKAETAPQSSGEGTSPSSRAADADSPTPPSAVGVKVYGQGQIDQLLSALFPHRQPLNDDES